MKTKRCIAGSNCGATCISKKSWCAEKLSEATSKVADTAAGQVQKSKPAQVFNSKADLQDYIESSYPSTLVGTTKIAGKLLAEALKNDMTIENFFSMGDEGEFIKVDKKGNVVDNYLYY